MGGVGIPNPSMSHRTRDLLSSAPILSLSLAGIPRDGEAGEPGGDNGCGRREEVLEISSETSGPAGSRHDDYSNAEGEQERNSVDGDGDGDDWRTKKKKRKKYHRHTVEQIRQMEALFKESPHPDEKQRQQLSKQLGLHPRQVKFWFQNRRTQIKAIQERHENSLLKSELEKLQEENRALREMIKKTDCPNCGHSDSSKDNSMLTVEKQLLTKNDRAKNEVKKLHGAIARFQPETSTTSSSCLADKQTRKSFDFSAGLLVLDKPKIMDVVNQAAEELVKMSTLGDPLWIRSFETGVDILNYDEYMKQFSVKYSSNYWENISVEASRESGIVFTDFRHLIQSFMDVNQWKEMFPCMISEAATVKVFCNGNVADGEGAIQLMFAQLQMPTPLVATREVYFFRYSKKLRAGLWAIVDVSIDKIEDSIDAAFSKCRKRPSGCIIEDKSNGHCKVIWVEHMELKKSTINFMYRAVVNSGLAFGARRWMATLQLHCEWIVFFMATNVPTKDSNGVATLAGKKSILKFAQRMRWSFCRAVGASNVNKWGKVPTKTGEDIRLASRTNVDDTGEPRGHILCAVSSIWLPVSSCVLFDFLRDETRRNEWDIMTIGGPVQSIAKLAKGQDRDDAVTVQAITGKENSTWMLQDSSTNVYESMVVYSPVDKSGMRSVMMGCDSSDIAILPSGFSIVPEGLESRPILVGSKVEGKISEGGSLLTVAFQILSGNAPTATRPTPTVESVNTLLSWTIQRIKSSLQCDEG